MLGMQRFMFNVFNRTGHSIDEEGAVLAGVDVARRKALESIRSIISAEACQGMIDLVGYIEVLDDSGHRVLKVAFAEAFELHLPQNE
ncbi:MAG: hypothetical protein CVT76_03975 [Alphaproteobacteria bacterium HGW-Alphaproteobacteria-15]|nr:MAG: hypothetical protein CVT76_03975 [Alphaproteobacteria bacterium HGW-Alphaproteobacteria-15]